MIFQGVDICFFAHFDALKDVEDDAGEPVFVEVHFLVVWYLSDLAGCGELVYLLEVDGTVFTVRA